MTQREMQRLTPSQRDAALMAAARALSRQLNAYSETPRELASAARESDAALEEQLRRWLTPECHHRRGTCDHGFPAWFCREAEPAANALRRIARQYRAAEALAREAD